MQVLLTVVRKGQEPQDVVVTVEENTTVADLARELGGPHVPAAQGGGFGPPVAQGQLAPALAKAWQPQGQPAVVQSPYAPQAPAPSLWLDGWRADPAAPVAPLLRDGMRVSTDDELGPLLRSAEPTGQLELRVVGGPAAGRVARLSVGAATVGSGATCSVPLAADTTLPDVALRIGIDVQGTAKVTPAPGLPAYLNDEPVTERQVWPLGAMMAIGESLLVLDRPTEPDAHLAPTGEGGLAYNRPPRLLPVHQRPRLFLPSEPTRADSARLNIITSLVPMAFGLTMYFVMDSVYMLLFCLMSPLMMLASYLNETRYRGKKYKKSAKQYREELIQYGQALNAYVREDQRIRREASPDPAEILLFATGPRRRLWERRLTDPDVMHLRVGVAPQRADIEIVTVAAQGKARYEPPEPPHAPNLPVPLAFPEIGVVGVAGQRERALATARWLTVQAATLHSPRDLSLVVLSSVQDAPSTWGWAHWLPHTTPQQGQPCISLVASEPEPIGRRVNELLNELNRRKELAKPGFNAPALRPEPFILVILDGARLLRRMPGVPQLLQEGPAHGILALCIDEDERLLPEECKAVVSWSPHSDSRVMLRGSGLETIGEVLADQVAQSWCERIARSLAPVRDVSRDDADAAIPTSARLLNLLSMPNPTGADIERIWRAGGQTTAAPIGVTAEGTFVLDIKRDGPHALVAGTTGAGKSELLQTIIASLAVANHPDALNFVLIDYKGGSAFQDCANLPHTVGMVSDLDAHLTERALASLAAELHRREEILFRTGNKDIEDYNDTRKLRPELEPMPRLMIVIDEFASLVAELPDFIAGLVDIARRGRSLGVHLILATQRPAGVVSADIRANTNLRIALRVTDASESMDVIDAPDSGAIAKSTPGRCFVRSGAQSLVGVQSARIGGRRPRQDNSGPTIELIPLTWSSYARPLPRRQEAEDDGTMVTDLAVLVEAIRDGAARMGFGEPHSPWLPPLPDKVQLSELPPPPPDAGSAGDVPPLAFGVTDMPSEQARVPLSLDLVRGDHMMIVGGPRAGRSTALRTLAGAIASSTSPSDVHLYAIDCGSNAMLPLVGLPHTGAVVTREQPDRVRRLIDRLRAEISRRQQLLAERGAASAAEQRATAPPEERLPWMVLLLDAWEGYVSAFEKYNYGQLLDSIQQIFREGSAVGLKAVVSSDRRGMTGSMSSTFPDKLILRLADPNDYSAAGFRPRDVPSDMPPGRALQLANEGVRESQLALLAEDGSGQAQVAALQEIGRRARETWPEPRGAQRPMRVDALPTRITLQEAWALDPGFQPPSPLWAMLGVGGDELHPIGVDLEEMGPGFVIAGPPKSGRSTTLGGVAHGLLRAGVPIVLITPRRSPLRKMGELDGVLAVLGSDTSKNQLLETLEPVKDRQYAVLVDDAELLYDGPLDKPLEEIIKTGMDGEHALIAAGTLDSLASQYRGFVATARKSRNGLVLRPRSPGEGELFGVRLPANTGSGPVGSGVLITGGTLTPIQSAMLD
ncbi:FtsK/SpoIIIE domain-containing protein [Streptomyces sp. 7-21]|uniref:FtsK/SpoIIIE domain-containing protein n=1 Tax=Streptomyces sp. 7-21 TaxID=2802283 RepID=UPI00191DBBEA|nr:FtsK/SpoIIIE domain-containing protein [Streptomyces sp. 7-21]MBL1066411.1 cell division protein FtsK [Streptomyces sp. 7-21]